MRLVWLIKMLMAAILLSACAATPMEKAENYQSQGEWMKTVLEYRKALQNDPANIQAKLRLKQAELKAADHYYDVGRKKQKTGNLDGAIIGYQQGLTAMPDHAKLLQVMGRVLAMKEANRIAQEAGRFLKLGREKKALNLYKQALVANPRHKQSLIAIKKLGKKSKKQGKYGLLLSSKSPVTLNFRRTRLKTAFDFIGKSFGINIIFDETIKDKPVTMFAKDITFYQAINLLLTTSQTFYKRIGPNSILVAPDTAAKRGQYEDYFVKTFHLNTVRAKDMASILKGVIKLKKIIVNERLNTLVVRDTEDSLKMVSRVIAQNDRKPAEMILDVEILEVSKTKSERLGLDLGYEITAKFSETALGAPLGAMLSTGVVTLPATTFRFFKQEVDAKTLANPKIRVLSGKKAKIHIGDRIPLRSSSQTVSDGTVRTTYSYTDIGIRLSVEPTIHFDNSVTVKIALEVSTLGADLGTTSDPAFSIGTRNTETVMLLRDGETAIMGGLIRDEERNTKVTVPGLGAIPIIGRLFSSYERTPTRTDVLLTITPRIIRPWDLMTDDESMFFSGTEKTYSSESKFAYLESESDTLPRISTSSVSRQETKDNIVGNLSSGKPSPLNGPFPKFRFSKSVFEVSTNEEFTVTLMASNLKGISSVPVEILYNTSLISFVRADAGDKVANFDADADSGRGIARVSINFSSPIDTTGEVILGKLILKGKRSGISYLVYRSPILKNDKQERVHAQVQASRVVIK